MIRVRRVQRHVSSLFATALALIAWVSCENYAKAGESFALLIGCDDYKNVPLLTSSANDVTHLVDTLIRYGSYPSSHVQGITDRAESHSDRPYISTLQREIPRCLGRATPEDSVLVYFSGHGYCNEKGTMFLAPIDFDSAKPEETGIAVDWLRQELSKCRAGTKLLVLDCCHAGAQKLAISEVSYRSFENLEGVVTLASSKGDETSHVWPEKARSVYSYWLTEGLKGHANVNSDDHVDIDELYQYVLRRVKRTARLELDRSQTPVRIIGPNVTQVANVVTLTPQPLRDVLANMAEHLIALAEEQKIKRLGVLEFADDSPLRDWQGTEIGLIGKFCGDELERHLLGRASDSELRIVDRNRLHEAIRQQDGFGVEDLSSPQRLAALANVVGDMQALVVGGIVDRSGPIMKLNCKLKDTVHGDYLGATGGVAKLSENDWAMLGFSASQYSDNRIGPGQQTAAPVEQWDRRAELAHPLQHPEFLSRYNVRIRVGDRFLEPQFKGNDCYVAVRAKDKYEIYLENRTGEPVVTRVLVDGLDTGLGTIDASSHDNLSAQPITHLDNAKDWILDPNRGDVSKRNPQWRITGFATKLGRNGKSVPFIVAPHGEALAAKRGYTDQIGLITVAFYQPEASSQPRDLLAARSVGTTIGKEEDTVIYVRSDIRAGRQLAVVHIRYTNDRGL